MGIKAQNLEENILEKLEIFIHKTSTEDHEEKLLKKLLGTDDFKVSVKSYQSTFDIPGQ
jgi:hypothetical protein